MATLEQKMQAVRAALAKLVPPVTDEREVERYVVSFDAMFALLPTQSPPPPSDNGSVSSIFIGEPLSSKNPTTQAEIDAAADVWLALIEKIRKEREQA